MQEGDKVKFYHRSSRQYPGVWLSGTFCKHNHFDFAEVIHNGKRMTLSLSLIKKLQPLADENLLTFAKENIQFLHDKIKEALSSTILLDENTVQIKNGNMPYISLFDGKVTVDAGRQDNHVNDEVVEIPCWNVNVWNDSFGECEIQYASSDIITITKKVMNICWKIVADEYWRKSHEA